MPPIFVMRLLGPLAFALLEPAAVLAQAGSAAQIADPPSYVVQWGNKAYDTRSREGRLQKVVCGWNNTAHLRTDGRLFIQGIGATVAPGLRMVTEPPDAPPGLFYTDVSINFQCGMAIRSDGAAIGWGALGVTLAPPAAPPLPPGLAYTRVALSNTHGLLLRTDGTVVAFGANTFGECNVPALPPGVPVTDLQASYGRSAILLADGSVALFGANQFGQSSAPALPPGVVYTAMAAKRNTFTLLLRSDGHIEAFGSNASGECNVPALPLGVYYTHIATGDGLSVAARSDNTFAVWGATSASYGLNAHPSIPLGLRCVTLDCGQAHVATLLSNGKSMSWGGPDESYCHYVPYRNPPGNSLPRHYKHVSTGLDFSLLTYTDGTVEGLGLNNVGQLVLPLLPPRVRYVRAEAGGLHSLGLRTDGEIVAVGFNGFGALNVPPLPAGMTYTDMSATVGHSVVLRSDGQAFAFGINSRGQCNVPPLPSGIVYTKVSANDGLSLFLRSDGILAFCGGPLNWGPPPNPPPGTRFVDIAAGWQFCCALASDNTLVAWGSTAGSQWVSPPPLPAGVYYVEIRGANQMVIMRRSDGSIDVMGQDGFNAARVPRAEPGTSCLQLGGNHYAHAARFGPTRTYVGVSPGCGGSMPAAKLIPLDTPSIGSMFQLRIRNAPASLAALGMGFQRTSQPLPLAGIGMPGCALAIQVDAVAMLTGTNQEVLFQLRIPDQPSLVGLRFYNQALVLDPNAGNGIGAVLSEASEGVIGYR